MLQYVRDPRTWFAGRRLHTRAAFNAVYRTLYFPTARRYEKLARSIPAPQNATLCISEQKGYTLIPPDAFPALTNAVREARSLFDQADLEQAIATMTSASPFCSLPFNLNESPGIAALAIDHNLIHMLSKYLGILPILGALNLMFSPNQTEVPASSQLYHLDGQDIRSIQVFVFVRDVTQRNGALTILPARQSAILANRVRYRKSGRNRRLADETVSRHPDLMQYAQEITGPAGSMLIFDGDRCFHYGSRQASEPRHVLHLFYSTIFSFTLQSHWGSKFGTLADDSLAPWQRGVIRPD